MSLGGLTVIAIDAGVDENSLEHALNGEDDQKDKVIQLLLGNETDNMRLWLQEHTNALRSSPTKTRLARSRSDPEHPDALFLRPTAAEPIPDNTNDDDRCLTIPTPDKTVKPSLLTANESTEAAVGSLIEHRDLSSKFFMFESLIETIKSEHGPGGRSHWGAEDRRSKLLYIHLSNRTLLALWTSILSVVAPAMFRVIKGWFENDLEAFERNDWPLQPAGDSTVSKIELAILEVVTNIKNEM
jgi:hypothetical protein